jgi:hypothetical protein
LIVDAGAQLTIEDGIEIQLHRGGPVTLLHVVTFRSKRQFLKFIDLLIAKQPSLRAGNRLNQAKLKTNRVARIAGCAGTETELVLSGCPLLVKAARAIPEGILGFGAAVLGRVPAACRARFRSEFSS